MSAILFQHPEVGMQPHLPENYVTSVTVNYVPGGALDKNHFINFHRVSTNWAHSSVRNKTPRGFNYRIAVSNVRFPDFMIPLH